MADEQAPPPQEEPEAPRWEHREELKIQGKMREVVKMTIGATEKEIEGLRRKVARLTYGS